MEKVIFLLALGVACASPNEWTVTLLKSYNFENGNTELACQVNFTPFPTESFSLEWKHNGQVMKPLVTIEKSGFEFLQVSTAGQYECSLVGNDGEVLVKNATEVTGERFPSSMMIDRKLALLYVQAELGTSATWSIIVHHNSIPLHLLVVDDHNRLADGFEVVQVQLHRNQSTTRFTYWSEFAIVRGNVSGNDGKKYEVIVSDGKMFLQRVIILEVIDRPTVFMKKQLYYENGEIATVQCRIKNLGTINEDIVREQVEVLFYECVDEVCETPVRFNEWTIENGATPDDISLTISFEAESNGYLSCGASNKVGTSSIEHKVCVSDAPPSLNGTLLSDSHKEGDQALFTCRISTCTYDKSYGIQWFYAENEASSPEPIEATSVEQGMSSIRSMLNVGRVKHGIYSCKGSYASVKVKALLATLDIKKFNVVKMPFSSSTVTIIVGLTINFVSIILLIFGTIGLIHVRKEKYRKWFRKPMDKI